MSSTTKLKMNYRKFNTIWTTVVAVLVVVAIAATVVMNFFSLSMEIFLGRGARVVEPDPEMSNVDTAYYESNAGSTDELNERTNQTAQAIAEQGIVLMKNNNDALPIAKQSKVTPFGYRALSEFFTVNSDVEKAMDEATARGLDSDGYQKPDEKTGFEGSTDTIIEFDPSIYDGLEDSANGTTGIVFIGRSGGEGGDVTADMPGSAIEGKGYADGTPHQLAISQDERNTATFPTKEEMADISAAFNAKTDDEGRLICRIYVALTSMMRSGTSCLTSLNGRQECQNDCEVCGYRHQADKDQGDARRHQRDGSHELPRHHVERRGLCAQHRPTA